MLDKEAITRLREAKGLSQGQAARTAGWKVQQWNVLESGGTANPRLDTLLKLAEVLGCSLDDLVSRKRRRAK